MAQEPLCEMSICMRYHNGQSQSLGPGSPNQLGTAIHTH